MSAGKAFLICTNISWPCLQLRDTEIMYCTDAAAEEHGYGSAGELIGRRLSEIQPACARQAAQRQHLFREHGYAVDNCYHTIMMGQDGRLRGHRREVIWRVSAGHDLTYCVEVQGVGNLPDVAVPDLAAYGLDETDFVATCGKLNVQQLKDQVRSGNIELPYAENLRMILMRCQELSIPFCRDDETGVDVLLSGQVNWTLYGRTPGLVKVRQHCDACGWQWDTAAFQAIECPKCRAYQPSRIAGATPDEVRQMYP